MAGFAIGAGCCKCRVEGLQTVRGRCQRRVWNNKSAITFEHDRNVALQQNELSNMYMALMECILLIS